MSKKLDELQLSALFYVNDSPIHGKGLFARTFIKKGDYLGTYDGPEAEEDDSHVLWAQTETDEWVGRDGKNILRYLNHSGQPCAEFYEFDLYATSHIEPGTEVTIDYGEEPAAEV